MRIEKKLTDRTILIIEDDHRLRAVLSLALEKEKFRVIEAADPVEADRHWNLYPEIALVIADIGLPGGSGRDFASLLRFRNPKIKVLLISGTPQTSEEAGKGMTFLLKPFTAKELIDAVNQVFEAES